MISRRETVDLDSGAAAKYGGGSGIDRGAPVTDALSIPGWLQALTRVHGGHPCVIDEADSLSFDELESASSAIARGLLARGVGKGTRVGILFGNGTRWVTWWAAITRIGAVCIPLSTFLQPAELGRAVRHADLHTLVAQRRFLERDFAQIICDALPTLADCPDAELALPEAPFLRTIVLDEVSAPWTRSVEWVVDAGRADHWARLLEHAQREVHPDEETLCIYTSGQSADPKGVFFSHRAIVTKARYLCEMFGFTNASVTEVTMPFFWVGGLVMALFPTMAAGGTTRCTERSTWGSGAVIGNSAATSDTLAGFRKLPALGMTETFGMYSWGSEWAVDPYPIAAPIDELQPGFEVRLVDDQGGDVADGTPGQILVRGPTVATRLQKVSRAEVYDDDGFYRTGDLAVRHGPRLSFLGRIQDMIKTSGANVSPAEVERELAVIDGIAVAHVVGLDDVERGQLVAAAVVRAEGSTITEDDITELLRARLSVYKVPRVIVFLDSIVDVPMTPSLKVRKRSLADLVDARRYGGDVSSAAPISTTRP